jgi:hypothetical protein
MPASNGIFDDAANFIDDIQKQSVPPGKVIPAPISRDRFGRIHRCYSTIAFSKLATFAIH